MKRLGGAELAEMIRAGAESLAAHAKEINDLNVFPIPDGDTGDNMLMTVRGGILPEEKAGGDLSEVADRIAGGMLLSARGNSGVILSQLFEGLRQGLCGLRSADARELGEAFRRGVKQAYASVLSPTEGTLLTVMREATEYACERGTESLEAFFDAFSEEAERSLERTPELLPVLKRAGVVDSGAAGLVRIAEGMRRVAHGEVTEMLSESTAPLGEPDLDAFREDSVLEFGYCTELLLRLQTAKVDLSAFDIKQITDPLCGFGESVVAVRSGSIVKLHVHTATPQRVLALCQQYGEFLKVKIENMSLQHNSTVIAEDARAPVGERKRYGVVAVVSGEGLKAAFRDLGADAVVDGGRSMNPSAEELIAAFEAVNAEVILVLPNNSNTVLTARQAAELYPRADVRVIESRTVGEGYAALAMLDPTSEDADRVVEDLCLAMDGVVTAEISRCIRDASFGGRELHRGDYVGLVGKEILAADTCRLRATCRTVDGLDPSRYEVLILFVGREASEAEAERIAAHAREVHGNKEIHIVNGGQEVYDYIIVAE